MPRQTLDHQDAQDAQRPPSPRRSIPMAAIAGSLVVAAACAPRAVPPDVGLPPTGATVSEIARSPRAYAGRIVTVSGEVNRVFGPRWFSIGGEGFGGSEELLVVGPAEVPSLLNTLADSFKVGNDLVQVTGVVRVFEEDAVEQEIGADLDGDWWRLFDARPVLIMTDLDITPRVDVVAAAAAPVLRRGAPITDELTIVTERDRTRFVGLGVSLIGTKVQAVVGPSTFWVGSDPTRRLFVALDSAAVRRSTSTVFDVEPGQLIAVTGVITGVPWDLSHLRSRWSITAADEIALRRHPIYLAATDVVILDAGPRTTTRCVPLRKADLR